MGTPDDYTGHQLKPGNHELNGFCIGDVTALKDGVYVATTGVVVIKNSVFVAEFPFLRNMYGSRVEIPLKDIAYSGKQDKDGLKESKYDELSLFVESLLSDNKKSVDYYSVVNVIRKEINKAKLSEG